MCRDLVLLPSSIPASTRCIRLSRQFCCPDTTSSTTPTAQMKKVTLITQQLLSWTVAEALRHCESVDRCSGEPAGAAALNTSQYAAFGHGTMVAGLVHLVAPTAKILPLKAFSADGTGYVSNVIRALYFATAQGSKVVSMSFSFSNSSSAMSDAIKYANSQGVICVAAAGNGGEKIKVYPASLSQVMGVASTSNSDTLSSFSNYGPQVEWVGSARGEHH